MYKNAVEGELPHKGTGGKNAGFKATILDLWTNGLEVEDIIGRLRLNISYYSFVSSDIPKNATWVLRVLKAMAPSLREPISNIITYIETGSKSEVALSLQGVHRSLGRNSIISISRLFGLSSKSDLTSIAEADFVGRFRDKPNLAREVYAAIKEKTALA